MNPVKAFPGTRRALGHLREKFERAGRGTMVRVARKLGLHSNFFSEIGRRKRLDVGLLVAALRELDVSPAAFFAELEGDAGEGVGLWGPIRDRATPETRRAVRFAYRRMRSELAGVDLVAELEDEDGDEEPPEAAGPPLGAAWLEDLDGRRQDEPETVAAEVAAHLHRIEPALLPRALGVWCSALRLLLELDVAAYVNRWAVRLAEAAGDSATVADLYIRRSYLLADGGSHRRALTLAELATGIFARLGDTAGKGRALVDCGRWLHYLGRLQRAIESTEHALELLPDKEIRYRFAATHGLGLLHMASGELEAAERCADLAEPLSTVEDHRGRLLRLRSSICRKRGQLPEAEAHCRRALEIFRRLHLGEAALSAIDLVEVVLEQGKPGEARNICRSLWPLLEPLEANPIISAAVGELLRADAHGSLNLDLLERIRAQIRNEQTRNDARARCRWRALAMTI